MKTKPGTPATTLLVHGAYCGAWCWSTVEEELHRLGIPTLAVNRWTEEVPPRVVRDSMENHRIIRIIRAALDQLQAPVVLVGHSAAGRYMTSAAAGHPKVCHLVYLAALMPGGEIEGGGTDAVARARVEH